MAKGDEKRARNMQKAEGDEQRTRLETYERDVANPNLQMFRQNYQQAVPGQMADYRNLMGQANDYAQTGGLTPQDEASMRARALSPTRAIYANAQRDVSRQRALQGGYSPGYSTMMGRMAREQGQGISDAAINAEASLAGLKQQGRLGGINAGAGLYGATPGQAATFGNQVLGSAGQYSDLMNMYQNRQNAQYQMMGQIMQDPGTSGRVAQNIKNIGEGVGQAVGGVAMAASDRDLKYDIQPITDDVLEAIATLPISTWKYIGDDVTHIGPMAQDIQKHFGIGDGKTIALVDVMGILLAAQKAIAQRYVGGA